MSDLAIATPPAAAPAAASTDIPSNTPKPTNGTPAGNGAPAGGAPAQPSTNGKPPEGAKIESVKKEVDPVDPNKPFLVKVNGKEYHLSKDEALKLAEKGMGADKKFEEAAKIRGEAAQAKQMASQFFQLLKTDPMAILTNPKIGIDFKKIAEEYLAAQYKLETMDPKDRELLETKDKLKLAEDEKKKASETEQQKRFDELKNHHKTQIEKEVMGAIDQSGLPKTRYTVSRVAYYMAEGLRRGVAVTASDVIDIVKTDFHQHMSELMGGLDGEKLIEIMGDGNVKKLNEALMKKIKGGADPAIPAPANNAPAGSDEPKKISKKEFRKQLDERGF